MSGIQEPMGNTSTMIPTAPDFERSLPSMTDLKWTIMFYSEDVSVQKSDVMERLAKEIRRATIQIPSDHTILRQFALRLWVWRPVAERQPERSALLRGGRTTSCFENRARWSSKRRDWPMRFLKCSWRQWSHWSMSIRVWPHKRSNRVSAWRRRNPYLWQRWPTADEKGQMALARGT